MLVAERAEMAGTPLTRYNAPPAAPGDEILAILNAASAVLLTLEMAVSFLPERISPELAWVRIS